MTDIKLHIDVTHVGFVQKTICTHLANVLRGQLHSLFCSELQHQQHQYVESYVQVKHFVLWLKPVVGLSDAPM